MIRTLKKQDIEDILLNFTPPWSTREKTEQLWKGYLEQQEKGRRTVFVVEEEAIIGYGSLLRRSENLHFAKNHVPEVNSVWIDEKHRKKGYGKALIAEIEKLAKKEGFKQLGLGVGLYADYGPAQRLYYHLGYIPDGNGITYQGVPAVAGNSYPLDDDLLLWLVKDLK